MESNNTIRVCGSVYKKESIVFLKSNILANSVVAEANFPYANYYGSIPEKSIPNSLFLFTRRYYSLIDVLRFAKEIGTCAIKSTDIASSVLSFMHYNHPAIRIKNFPEYKKLPELQKCLIKAGVEFAPKIKLSDFVQVSINKCFMLKKIEDGIFTDLTEKHKGYVIVNKLLNENEFKDVLSEIRNNSSCHLFDAAKCGVIMDSEVKEMVRIYSEKLDVALLKCIQGQFNNMISNLK